MIPLCALTCKSYFRKSTSTHCIVYMVARVKEGTIARTPNPLYLLVSRRAAPGPCLERAHHCPTDKKRVRSYENYLQILSS
jgi:hypothetical protein